MIIYYSIKKQIYILRHDVSWSCSNHQWNSVYFRSTCIASIYINTWKITSVIKERKVFSGSRIRHYSFADFIILVQGYLHLQKSPLSLEHSGSMTGCRSWRTIVLSEEWTELSRKLSFWKKNVTQRTRS